MKTSGALMVCAALLVAGAADAHPRGMHKRDRVVLQDNKVEVLITLDIDSGERAALLRSQADLDHDGELSEPERQQLKEKLQSLATRPLEVTLSGYKLTLAPLEAKLSLRDDRTATSDEGLSLAVLLEGALPGPILPGTVLTVEDQSPDLSHVKVEAEQQGQTANGPYAQSDLQPGERLTLRLQSPM